MPAEVHWLWMASWYTQMSHGQMIFPDSRCVDYRNRGLVTSVGSGTTAQVSESQLTTHPGGLCQRVSNAQPVLISARSPTSDARQVSDLPYAPKRLWVCDPLSPTSP